MCLCFDTLALIPLKITLFHFVCVGYPSLIIPGCAYHAPDVSVSLSPAGISTHSEGERVEIVCTAVAVDRHEQPFWYHDGPSPTPCTSPNYQLSSRFEESACQWTTVLTLPDFKNDSAGSYICSVGRHGNNITLLLEGGYVCVFVCL